MNDSIKELIDGIYDDLVSAFNKVDKLNTDVNLSQLSDKETMVMIMLNTDIRSAKVRAANLKRLRKDCE